MSKPIARMKAIADQLDRVADELMEEGEDALADICTGCVETLREAIVEAES